MAILHHHRNCDDVCMCGQHTVSCYVVNQSVSRHIADAENGDESLSLHNMIDNVCKAEHLQLQQFLMWVCLKPIMVTRPQTWACKAARGHVRPVYGSIQLSVVGTQVRYRQDS